MSTDELIAIYEDTARSTLVGTDHYLEELRYREHSAVAAKMEQFTRRVHHLTLVIALMTAVSTVSVLYSVLAGASSEPTIARAAGSQPDKRS